MAVGEFPDVVGDAIRDELQARFGGEAQPESPLERLQELRADLQHEALSRIWSIDSGDDPRSAGLREALAATACELLHAAVTANPADADTQVAHVPSGRLLPYSIAPGNEDSVSLLHPLIRETEGLPGSATAVPRRQLGVVHTGGRPVCLCLLDEDEARLLSPESLPALMSAAAGREPFVVREAEAARLRLAPDGRTIMETEGLLGLSPWIIPHDELRVPLEPQTASICPAPPRLSDARVEVIGEVWVEDETPPPETH